MRHGQAHPDAINDAARQLTDHGRAETAQIIQQTVFKKNITISKFISSPYVRAQQTAQIVKQILQFPCAIETTDYLLPDADPNSTFDFLSTQKKSSIFLFTHQPLVGCLLSLLQYGAVAEQHVPTSGLVHVTIDEPLMVGCGVIRWQTF